LSVSRACKHEHARDFSNAQSVRGISADDTSNIAIHPDREFAGFYAVHNASEAVSQPFLGFKSRRGEVFNRRNILSVLRIERFGPRQDLSPRRGGNGFYIEE